MKDYLIALAVLLIISIAYFIGDHNGSNNTENKWLNKQATAEAKAKSEHDRLQDEANAKSAAYESEAAKRRADSINFNRRLKDEIAKNNTYRNCLVSDDFVQIYTDAVSGGSGKSAP